MAKRTVVTTLCDMHHDGEVPEAVPVMVGSPEGDWALDLCPEHIDQYVVPLVLVSRRMPRTAWQPVKPRRQRAR